MTAIFASFTASKKVSSIWFHAGLQKQGKQT
jgi:hypothetical protein